MSTIYIDVDVPTLRLHPKWLKLYNADFNDNFTEEMITCWDFHVLLKSECGTKVYAYLDKPDLYDDVEPTEGALFSIY